MIQDLLNEILKYVDNKTYFNCLVASKQFHTYKINDLYYNQYLSRKYINKYIYNLAHEGDVVGVKYFCTKKNQDTWFAMYMAIEHNQLEVVEFLYNNDKNKLDKKIKYLLGISSSHPRIYNFFDSKLPLK